MDMLIVPELITEGQLMPTEHQAWLDESQSQSLPLPPLPSPHPHALPWPTEGNAQTHTNIKACNSALTSVIQITIAARLQDKC